MALTKVTNDLQDALAAAQPTITSTGTLTGLTVTGEITANGGIALGDNDELTLGDSDEFKIKHHASGYTHLQNTVGTLYIDSDSVTFRDDDGSPSNMVISQTGINVAGTVTVDDASGTATIALNDSRSNVNDTAVIDFRHNGITGSQIKSTAIEDFSTSANRSSDLSFHVRNNGTIIDAAHIDSSGNVGIAGQTNPTYKLDGGFANQTWGWYLNSSYNAGMTYNTTERSLSIHTKSADVVDHIKFATGGSATERMRIDSAGRVTQPYQPAFKAGRSTNYTPSQNTAIVFNDASSAQHFNIGGHYSTSNGRFTCPVAGRYFFHTVVIYGPALTEGKNMADAFSIQKNGALVAYSHRRAEYVLGTTGNAGYFVDHATVVLNCAANQYVEVNSQAFPIHGNTHYTYFTGYLIG
jgi:hypothetical protein